MIWSEQSPLILILWERMSHGYYYIRLGMMDIATWQERMWILDWWDFPYSAILKFLNIHDYINGKIRLGSNTFKFKKKKNLIKAESKLDS